MKHPKRIVLFTLIVMNLVDQPAPEVTIDQGILSGKISADGSFFEYLGIPYATTNVSTRFKAPLPPPSWDGVFKAVDEHYSCPQLTFIGVMGTEDCLKINVYVPAMAQKPLPVMVFVHGGAFIYGTGGKAIYGPELLVKQDIILVTFNYRLGALGFVCLGIKEAPGNAALKDQVAALRWVNRNIAAFGGDPDNVTIFGQSAGGTSVSLLIASETTEGLFKRAIVQSGSSLANWAINRKPVWSASLIVKDLGYETEDPKEIYDILSNAPYKDLIATATKKPISMYFDTLLLNLPCVENDLPDEEAFLTDLPYNIINKNPRNIPIIYGATDKEGLFLIAEDTDEFLEARNARYLIASDLEFETAEEEAATARRVRQFYFGDGNINRKNILNLSDLYTHLQFEMPAILESEIYANKINESIYNYYFTYHGGRNFLKYLSGYAGEVGACHADELLYLFKGRIWPFRINEQDKKMIELMTKMWTNFAKFGDPTPQSATDLPVKWVPSSKEGPKFLHIDEEVKMGPVINQEAYDMWKELYTKYRKKSI